MGALCVMSALSSPCSCDSNVELCALSLCFCQVCPRCCVHVLPLVHGLLLAGVPGCLCMRCPHSRAGCFVDFMYAFRLCFPRFSTFTMRVVSLFVSLLFACGVFCFRSCPLLPRALFRCAFVLDWSALLSSGVSYLACVCCCVVCLPVLSYLLFSCVFHTMRVVLLLVISFIVFIRCCCPALPTFAMLDVLLLVIVIFVVVVPVFSTVAIVLFRCVSVFCVLFGAFMRLSTYAMCVVFCCVYG